MSEYDEFSADFPQHGFESHIGEHIVTGRHDIDLPDRLSRGADARFYGPSHAARDVTNVGVLQRHMVIQHFHNTAKKVKFCRREQPLHNEPLRGTLSTMGAILSDGKELIGEANLSDQDRSDLEDLLDRTDATMAELNQITEKYGELTVSGQKRWLDSGGREEFETVRVTVERLAKQISGLSLSMKSIRSIIKKYFIDLSAEAAEQSSMVSCSREDLDKADIFGDIIKELLPSGIPEDILRKKAPDIRRFLRALKETESVDVDENLEDASPSESFENGSSTLERTIINDQDSMSMSHDPRFGPRSMEFTPVVEELTFDLRWSLRMLSRREKGYVLCRFTSNNDLNAVKFMLSLGANVNATQENGFWSPLQWAAYNGSLTMVNILLDHGALINMGDGSQRTALHRACLGGHLDVARRLLTEGADATATSIMGYTPLHDAAIQGFKDVAELMCSTAVDKEARTSLEQSALWLAVYAGNTATVSLLVMKGVDVNAPNKNGLSPLGEAAVRGYADIANLLIRNGADIDQKDEWGWTALHRAIQYDRLEVVRLLIARNADCQLADNYGIYPVHRAAYYGSLDALKVLILEERVPAFVQSHNLSTPLHEAATAGLKDVVHFLLWDGGMSAHLEAKDKDEFTPLYAAVSAGHLEIVRYLLGRGADCKTRDCYSWTLLHRAAYHGYVEIVRELLQHPIAMESKNLDCYTPLHEAADQGHLEVVKLLVEKGAYIEAIDHLGDTPLEKAYLRGFGEVVAYLKEAGASAPSEKLTQQIQAGDLPQLREYVVKHGLSNVSRIGLGLASLGALLFVTRCWHLRLRG